MKFGFFLPLIGGAYTERAARMVVRAVAFRARVLAHCVCSVRVRHARADNRIQEEVVGLVERAVAESHNRQKAEAHWPEGERAAGRAGGKM